jgi:hypothetical protein
MDMFIAGGFDSPYKTVAAEMDSAVNKKWLPSTIDLRATAVGSGGAQEVKTFQDLLTLIGKKSAGSISDLGIVGHASKDDFAFGGKVLVQSPPDVSFNQPAALINTSTITKNLATIKSLRDRFAKGAKITVFACHVGSGQALLDALSTAFGVCVHGFSDEVLWCIMFHAATQAPPTPAAITSRGKTFFDDSGQYASGFVSCNSFNPDIRTLVPDKKSCAGVPTQPLGGSPNRP